MRTPHDTDYDLNGSGQGGSATARPVDIDEVNPDLLVACQRADDGPQCTGGAALASDDLADVHASDPCPGL